MVKLRPAANQDLRLKMIVEPHPHFQRLGNDLYLDVPVPLDDAALGAEVEIATINGKGQLKIPAGSRNGQRIRLKGKGMPKLGSPDRKGDLFVVVRPVMPEPIDGRGAQSVRATAGAPHRKGVSDEHGGYGRI